MMKRAAGLLILLLVLLGAGASAEGLPGPFTGWFDHTSYMRSKPQMEKTNIGTIPEMTPILMTPVNEKYASVTWNGVEGYIYYPSALPMPEETAVEPYIVWSEGGKLLFDTSLARAREIGQIPRESPILVLRETDRCYYVRANGEQEGYIRRADLTRLEDDRAADGLCVADEGAALYEYPLSGARVLADLKAGWPFLIEGENMDWLRISDGVVTGYVRRKGVTVFREGQYLLAAKAGPEVSLAARPGEEGVPFKEDVLIVFDGITDGYYHLEDGSGFVSAEAVDAFVVLRPDSPHLCWARGALPAILMPDDGAPTAGFAVPGGTIFRAYGYLGDHLLVSDGGRWGFVDKRLALVLTEGEAMNQTAAVTVRETELIAPDGGRVTVPEGEKLFLTAMSGQFYQADRQGARVWLDADSVRLVGSDIPVTRYKRHPNREVVLMDFPDRALADTAATFPPGTELTVLAVNRCYMRVTDGTVTGYATQEGLLTAETQGMPADENEPRYELELIKSTFKLSVYALDENGQRTGKPVIQGRVAIGKRTTPTPSGRFLLGFKERWHRFSMTFTPFTTTYISARYIHGLPAQHRNPSTTVAALAAELGQAVTGGCLRSPNALARFIYFHCPSYQTYLTVKNAPDPTEAP